MPRRPPLRASSSPAPIPSVHGLRAPSLLKLRPHRPQPAPLLPTTACTIASLHSSTQAAEPVPASPRTLAPLPRPPTHARAPPLPLPPAQDVLQQFEKNAKKLGLPEGVPLMAYEEVKSHPNVCLDVLEPGWVPMVAWIDRCACPDINRSSVMQFGLRTLSPTCACLNVCLDVLGPGSVPVNKCTNCQVCISMGRAWHMLPQPVE